MDMVRTTFSVMLIQELVLLHKITVTELILQFPSL